MPWNPYLRSSARAQMGVSGNAARRFSTAATERRRAVYTTANARGSSMPKACKTQDQAVRTQCTLHVNLAVQETLSSVNAWQVKSTSGI